MTDTGDDPGANQIARGGAPAVYVTPGYRLVALDAKRGQPVAGFGRDGIVDLKQDFDQQLDLTTAPVGLHATPAVAGNVVIVGAAFETGANPKSKTNVKTSSAGRIANRSVSGGRSTLAVWIGL